MRIEIAINASLALYSEIDVSFREYLKFTSIWTWQVEWSKMHASL